MLKTLTGIVTLVFFTMVLQAQNKAINGIVKDQLGHPIAMVSIVLQSPQKSEIKTVSNEKGQFTFKITTSGPHILAINSIAYVPYQYTILNTEDSIRITLTPVNHQLKEVKIISNKPTIERKIDKVVFNVENSIAASGGTVWDALTKAPGVQTGFEESISLNGKSVLVYVDNKILRLSGEDLSNYLKSLPSDNISKMELIANPSSKYDAEGGAIINIISKKSITQGLNVNLNSAYNQSKYGSYNWGSNFNYRKNKVNIYGSYNYSDSKKNYSDDEYIIYDNVNDYALWVNAKRGYRKRQTSNYKLGVDYSISDNQVLGILFTGFNSNFLRDNNVITNIFNDHKLSIDSTLKTHNKADGPTNRYSFNFNYKIKLDTLGQSLNFDFDFAPYKNKGNQAISNITLLPDGTQAPDLFNVNTISKQKINIWSGKVDYSYAFNKTWSFDAGLKYSSIETNNSFAYFNLVTGSPILDLSKSDNFNYTENTFAQYLTLNGQINKFNIQAGLRGEYTMTNGHSITLDTSNVSKYFRLFPTVQIIYSIATDHDLNLAYSYRITRPDYWRLNPFKYYSSPYTYLEGNPALKPAYIQDIEIGYTYKQQNNITFFRIQTNGMFSNITVQDNVNKIFYDTQQNLNKSIETGFYLSVPVTAFKWWEMNYFVQGSYKQESSNYLQGSYNYHTLFIYLNTSQSFVINAKAGLKADISAWYSSPSIQGIFKLNRTNDISAGIRKNIFGNHGTIKLAVNDILYGNAYRVKVDYLNQHNGFVEKNDTRQISLSLTYKFGNIKLASARTRSTAAEDETKRARN